MNRKILAVLMSVVMLVMSVQVYGQSENNGYGENYQTHSGVSLYEEIDYQKLQADLQDFCIEQEKNGYTVTELTITYIMPEAIEQWLAGKEQEQFFGVSLSELEKKQVKIHLGTAVLSGEMQEESVAFLVSYAEPYKETPWYKKLF